MQAGEERQGRWRWRVDVGAVLRLSMPVPGEPGSSQVARPRQDGHPQASVVCRFSRAYTETGVDCALPLGPGQQAQGLDSACWGPAGAFCPLLLVTRNLDDVCFAFCSIMCLFLLTQRQCLKLFTFARAGVAQGVSVNL